MGCFVFDYMLYFLVTYCNLSVMSLSYKRDDFLALQQKLCLTKYLQLLFTVGVSFRFLAFLGKNWAWKRTEGSFGICGALRDLVPCTQFKKREKHPWRSVTFSKVAGLITDGGVLHLVKLVSQFGTFCTIWKTWKTSMEEWYL